jgi:hypothetical protein
VAERSKRLAPIQTSNGGDPCAQARRGPSSNVVLQPRSDRTPYRDLPLYLTEPVPEKHWELRRLVDDLSKTHRPAQRPASVAAGPSSAGGPPRQSPVFARQVPLSGGRLEAALDAWWAGDKAAVVTLQRRLQLRRPEGDVVAGWTMKGRLRRLTILHWVPVVVELWPVYGDFTRMTMTPQVHVFLSKRYFRLGHKVVDLLWARLAELSAPSARLAPPPRPLD